jgi:uncharacterized protein
MSAAVRGDFAAVDADGHVMEPPEMWAERLPRDLEYLAPRRTVDSQGRVCMQIADHVWVAPPRNPAWPVRTTGGSDPKVRLEDMDLEGIEAAVLFPTTGLFFAGIRERETAAALCRAYNDWLAEYCSADTARLAHVGLLPQADVRDTIAEARRCAGELGSVALMLRPNRVDGRNLEDPSYEYLWSALAEIGIPVVMHEGTTLNVPQSGDRFDNFAFRHACSHPHEQQFAVLSLTCGGVLERHPDLRVLFVEAGCGWVPYWLERLDEHMEHWDYATASLPLKPSEYFARQCFVTSEPDERTLPAVADLLGDDVLMWASDYPHPDGIFPGAVAALAERADLSDATKQKILRTNAQRCFGLST